MPHHKNETLEEAWDNFSEVLLKKFDESTDRLRAKPKYQKGFFNELWHWAEKKVGLLEEEKDLDKTLGDAFIDLLRAAGSTLLDQVKIAATEEINKHIASARYTIEDGCEHVRDQLPRPNYRP